MKHFANSLSRHLPVFALAAVVTPLIATSAGAATLVVNWDGEYTTSNDAKYRGIDGPVSTGQEWGDDGLNDDVRRNFVFSETNPLNPTIGPNYGTSTGQSARFFGGVEEWALDVTTTASVNTNGENVQNGLASDGGDANLIDNTNGSNRRSYALWLWQKADFFDGSTTANLTFDADSRINVDATVNNGNHFRFRAVVKDGSQYYLSQTSSQTVAGSPDLSVDPSATNWALYNPVFNLQTNPGSTSPTIANNGGASLLTYTPRTFTDIQAVGFYSESTDNIGANNRSFRWESFSASVLVPEPASSALLGLGSLLLIARRKRSA